MSSNLLTSIEAGSLTHPPYDWASGDHAQHAADELNETLTTRAVIDQTTGMIMAVHGCDAGSAYRLLAGVSRESQLPITQIAATLTQVVGNPEPAAAAAALAPDSTMTSALRALMTAPVTRTR